MEQDVARDEPADAAAAFEALRREVALLNVALAGLAARRASTPDYSETLGEISKGVSIAIGRLGKVLASPAFAMSPVDITRQITEAGDAARRQDREAIRHAQDGFVRATGDLRGWIDSARQARLQNRRLVQAGVAGALAGALLGLWAPKVVAHAAPDRWAWPRSSRLIPLVLSRGPLANDYWPSPIRGAGRPFASCRAQTADRRPDHILFALRPREEIGVDHDDDT